MSIQFAMWWLIPLVVTLVILGWWGVFAWKDFTEGGMFAGMGALMVAGPAAFIVAVAWFIGALCK